MWGRFFCAPHSSVGIGRSRDERAQLAPETPRFRVVLAFNDFRGICVVLGLRPISPRPMPQTDMFPWLWSVSSSDLSEVARHVSCTLNSLKGGI